MGEGSSAHHFEGRHDLVKEDMKKMTRKKACKARHVHDEQAGLPRRRSGSEGRGGMRRSVGGNHQGKALKDRTLLFGKHLSLAMGQLPSHLEMQHCTLALWRGPRHQAPEHSLGAPQGLAPRSPSEPFLGVPGISPCNFAYTTPNNRLLVLPVSPCWSHRKGAC